MSECYTLSVPARMLWGERTPARVHTRVKRILMSKFVFQVMVSHLIQRDQFFHKTESEQITSRESDRDKKKEEEEGGLHGRKVIGERAMNFSKVPTSQCECPEPALLMTRAPGQLQHYRAAHTAHATQRGGAPGQLQHYRPARCTRGRGSRHYTAHAVQGGGASALHPQLTHCKPHRGRGFRLLLYRPAHTVRTVQDGGSTHCAIGRANHCPLGGARFSS